MGRSSNNKRKTPKKQGPEIQPYAYELDLQKAGEQVTERSDSVMAGGMDADFTKKRSRFRAWFRMGNSADLSPLALAAIMLGICIFLVPVSIVLATTGNPGACVSVVALMVVLVLVAAGITYKTISRNNDTAPAEIVTTLRLETPTAASSATPAPTDTATVTEAIDPAPKPINPATVLNPTPISDQLPAPRSAGLNVKPENILREQPADGPDSLHAEGDPLV